MDQVDGDVHSAQPMRSAFPVNLQRVHPPGSTEVVSVEPSPGNAPGELGCNGKIRARYIFIGSPRTLPYSLRLVTVRRRDPYVITAEHWAM